jgi:8-amino-7-oxononanoate synthase
LTTGRPATLAAPLAARRAASRLAALQGLAAAVLAPSTLHLFWDLCGLLSRQPTEFYVDAGTYPIACWGVQRAATGGAVAQRFPHHDVRALHWRLRRRMRQNRRPIVVTDGVCPGCGRVAPLGDYLDCVRAAGGLLLVDDSQALGILGATPTQCFPYGQGGSGSLAWSGVGGPDVIVVSSLAKGFGVPLACLGGSNELVHTFLANSQTRLHCSPPCLPVLHAACHALQTNARCGDLLRRQLVARVMRLREPLVKSGLRMTAGFFPVQTIRFECSRATQELHRRLNQRGIRCLLQWDHHRQPACGFLITARHTPTEIDVATRAILEEARWSSQPSLKPKGPLYEPMQLRLRQMCCQRLRAVE